MMPTSSLVGTTQTGCPAAAHLDHFMDEASSSAMSMNLALGPVM